MYYLFNNITNNNLQRKIVFNINNFNKLAQRPPTVIKHYSAPLNFNNMFKNWYIKEWKKTSQGFPIPLRIRALRHMSQTSN